MYKILPLLLSALFVANMVAAQSLAINADGSAANASALLDIKSTTKGLLIPRMTKAERTGIPAPATGLLVFQNAPDSAGFYYYDGGTWNWMAAINGNADTLSWKRSGNALTNPATHFIGTTDNRVLNFKVNNTRSGIIDNVSYNAAFGYSSQMNNLSGTHNTSMGYGALISNSTGNYNTSVGAFSSYNNVAGIRNTAIGTSALYFNNANDNTAVGYEALNQTSSVAARQNTAVGSNAMRQNSTGTANTAVGDSAGYLLTAANYNVFFGKNAGRDNLGSWTTLIGIDAGPKNTANGSVFIGSAAGMKNTSGFGNTFVGDNAGREVTTSSNNTFFGSYAGQATTGAENTAIGSRALYTNTGGTRNTAIGYNSLRSNVSASYNTALGPYSLQANISGYENVAIGDYTMYNNTGGYRNTGVGSTALYYNNIGSFNTGLGFWALYNNTSGNSNTAIGHVAAYHNTVDYWQVAIGDSALFSNTGGAHNANVAIGAHAATYNPGSSGCIYIGFRSGYTSNGGVNNLFMGSYSGQNNTGSYNIGIGHQSLRYSTGIYNVALGSGAMQTSVSSTNNTALGIGAMGQDTSGTENTVTGAWAFYNSRMTSLNTVSGYQALYSHRSGNRNTANGHNALFSDTTGTQNVAVGYYAMRNYQGSNNTSLGTNSLDFMGTGNNNIAIGYDADVMQSNLSNAIAIGAFSRVDTSNALVLGSAVTNIGVGITKPYQAKLTVSANNALNGSTIAMFGPGQRGISIQQNNPTIAWNQFRDISAGNATRYMGSGFAWVNHMDPNTGIMYWNSMPSGTGGTAGGAETNRMTLTTTGSLGLNVTPNGSGQLQFQNVLDNRKIVMWETANNSTDFFGFGINSGTLRYQVSFGGVNVHMFYSGNNLLLTLFDNSNATLSSFLTQLSDARLKQDIVPINSTINDIKKINAYSYYWKDENKDRDQQIGLLAQEVDAVYPQLVKKDAAGLLSVNYNGFVPLLIKGMQEQQQQIEELKTRVEELISIIKK